MHRINSKWWHELWLNLYCHDDVTLSLTEYVQLREVQMNQFLVCSQLTTSIHWTYHCTVHAYVVIHYNDSLWVCEWNWIYAVFCRLFIYVLPLEIQLSRGASWDPISRLDSTTFVSLWISSIICRGPFVCSVSNNERRLFVLLIVDELMFRLSVHNGKCLFFSIFVRINQIYNSNKSYHLSI